MEREEDLGLGLGDWVGSGGDVEGCKLNFCII